MAMSLSQPGRGGGGGRRRRERRERWDGWREEGGMGGEGHVGELLTSSTSTVLSDSHLRRGSPMPAGRGSARASSPITVQWEHAG